MYSLKIYKNIQDFSQQICIDKTNKYVFTNGCFDLLHPGHLTYLSAARSEGDKLIVGLNSDESIKNIKGKGRPINEFSFRAAMLSFYCFIDYIIGYDEETPLSLVEIIKPKVLVKGGDYEVSKIVGADFVKSYGGLVKTIPFVEDFSTSSIIEKINNLTRL